MAYGFPMRRIAFFGGLAAVLWISQQVGFLPTSANTAVEGTDAGNNVMQVHNEDQAMAEAQRSAIATLATFMDAAETVPDSWEMATIKVALEGSEQIENIWVSDFRHLEGARFVGKLGNDPVNLPGLKAGDEVEFTYGQINDWAFIENGRGYGFYSVRAMLPMMEEAQANGMREFLSADPLPAGW